MHHFPFYRTNTYYREMKKLGVFYYCCCLWVLYRVYTVSKKARKRYSTRDLIDTTGRQEKCDFWLCDPFIGVYILWPKLNFKKTADENYDYAIFEFFYLQVPLMAVQFLSRFLLPKKLYFGFISIVSFITVLCMGSARIALFIVLAAYVSFLFQKEHPLWLEFESLILRWIDDFILVK